MVSLDEEVVAKEVPSPRVQTTSHSSTQDRPPRVPKAPVCSKMAASEQEPLLTARPGTALLNASGKPGPSLLHFPTSPTSGLTCEQDPDVLHLPAQAAGVPTGTLVAPSLSYPPDPTAG